MGPPPHRDLALEGSVPGFLTLLLFDLGQTLPLCALTLLLRHRQTGAHSPTCSSHITVTQEGSAHWKGLQVSIGGKSAGCPHNVEHLGHELAGGLSSCLPTPVAE